MANAIYYVSYKLKKDVSVPDFLLAAERLNDEHISKQAGFVSWKQMVDGDTWADMCTFETVDDLKHFEQVSQNPGEAALNFYSFINLSSCKGHKFIVEKTYE